MSKNIKMLLLGLFLLQNFIAKSPEAFAVTKSQCNRDGGKWMCSAFNSSERSDCCLLKNSTSSAQKNTNHVDVIAAPGAKLNCDGHVKRPDLYPRCSCCNPKPTKPAPKFI